MNKFSNRAYTLFALIAIAFCMVLIANFTFATDVAFAADESGEVVPVVSLTYGEETKEFTSFDAALEALKCIPIDSEEKTVRFLEDDVTIGNFDLSNWHRVFTLDLNGKRIVGSPSLIAAGSLTIRDSSAEQTGMLDLSTSSINCIFNEFVFESGTLKAEQNAVMFVDQTKKTTVRGGRIEARILVADDGNLQVEGGSIKELEVRNQASIKGGTIDKLIVTTNAQILSGGTILGFQLNDSATFKSMLCDGYAYQKADGSAMVKPSEMTAETAVNVVKCSHDSFTVSNGNHVCDYCGYVCTHTFVGDICTVCKYVCPHSEINNADRKCIECGGIVNVKVTHGTEVHYYVDFDYATEQLQDGDNMTILADIDLSKNSPKIGKNITVDLNGKKLTNVYIGIYSKVTVVDSTDGEGELNVVMQSNADVTVFGNSKTRLMIIAQDNNNIKIYDGIIEYAQGKALNYSDYVPAGYVYRRYTSTGSELMKIDDVIQNKDTLFENKAYLSIEKCKHSSINQADLTCDYCGTSLGSALVDLRDDLELAQSNLQAALDNKTTDINALNQRVNELNEAIEKAEAAAKAYAESQDTALKTCLEGKIEEAKTAAMKGASSALEEAKTALQSQIDDKASKSDVEASVAALNAAIANAETAKAYADQKDSELKEDLEGQIGTAKTTLEGKIAEAKTEVLNSAKSALDTAKTELSAKIATKAEASEVNKAIEDLNAAISNAESVNNAYADKKNAALKTELTKSISDSRAEVNAAIEALSKRLEAVENETESLTERLSDAEKSSDLLSQRLSATESKSNTLQTVLIVFVVLLSMANIATVIVFSLRKRK